MTDVIHTIAAQAPTPTFQPDAAVEYAYNRLYAICRDFAVLQGPMAKAR